ncbi:MAG: hypothetical protein IIA87_03090 [Nanoarchaeota archaeon]|nr:hypothetical protein [Nanoarchaeota archaeon]
MRSKKAQAWGFDLIIASTLFLMGIVVFYFYSLNYPTEGGEILDSLFYEGDIIAGTLLSDGYPDNWDQNNVVRVGILTNDKINETKLERFYTLTNETLTPGGYAKTKSLFNTKYEYYVNFSTQMNISGGEIDGIGKQPTDTKNLIKITRFVSYQNKPTTLYVYIWE